MEVLLKVPPYTDCLREFALRRLHNLREFVPLQRVEDNFSQYQWEFAVEAKKGIHAQQRLGRLHNVEGNALTTHHPAEFCTTDLVDTSKGFA